ncbi:MAG: hypothetical protein H0T75_08960 [Rhizobiales bacterium]|nr:hypothetical protein [Hyphomicrobiales bacterium]MDQ3560621.1 hypothetical protein [Pseudomonadota bacterium]
MNTPLNVAVDIGRLIDEAREAHSPIDVSNCAAELYLRFLAAGCSRQQITEALRSEGQAAGVTLH